MNEAFDPCEPAFPTSAVNYKLAEYGSGMTLRDYFAAKAMQGLLANGDADAYVDDMDWNDAVVSNAYGMADAMLRYRNEGYTDAQPR